MEHHTALGDKLQVSAGQSNSSVIAFADVGHSVPELVQFSALSSCCEQVGAYLQKLSHNS